MALPRVDPPAIDLSECLDVSSLNALDSGHVYCGGADKFGFEVGDLTLSQYRNVDLERLASCANEFEVIESTGIDCAVQVRTGDDPSLGEHFGVVRIVEVEDLASWPTVGIAARRLSGGLQNAPFHLCGSPAIHAIGA